MVRHPDRARAGLRRRARAVPSRTWRSWRRPRPPRPPADTWTAPSCSPTNWPTARPHSSAGGIPRRRHVGRRDGELAFKIRMTDATTPAEFAARVKALDAPRFGPGGRRSGLRTARPPASSSARRSAGTNARTRPRWSGPPSSPTAAAAPRPNGPVARLARPPCCLH